jgi:anthranilate phosphoribosyltransferase
MTTPDPFPSALSGRPTDPADYVRKVGKGRTLLKSLERDEAASAFSLLLRGSFTESQAGAFLQALRIKELSPDELDGLMDCLVAGQPSAVPVLPSGGFTLNLASDTPRKGGYASLLAAALLAGEGLPVGVVRSEPVLSKNRASWDGTWSMVRATPMKREVKPSVAELVEPGSPLHDARCDDVCSHAPASLCVVEANDLVPRLRNLRKIRGELGFRSCLHTAEKLLNPWKDKPLVLGISHRHYADRLADHFARRGMAAKIVLGNHGTTDLVLHKETEVWEALPDGTIRTVHFHPDELGLAPDAAVYSLGAFAQWAEELAKPGHGALGPVLDYHLAFFRYVTGVSSSNRGLRDGARLTPVLAAHVAGGVA